MKNRIATAAVAIVALSMSVARAQTPSARPRPITEPSPATQPARPIATPTPSTQPARPVATTAPASRPARPVTTTSPATQPARPGAQRPTEASERAKLAGFWKGVCGPIKLELTIKEKTIHGIQITDNGNVDQGVGEFTINLNTTPYQLDAVQTNERGRKTTYSGIYTVEGDVLKWCLSRGNERPTEFQESRGVYLVVVKKENAAGTSGQK